MPTAIQITGATATTADDQLRIDLADIGYTASGGGTIPRATDAGVTASQVSDAAADVVLISPSISSSLIPQTVLDALAARTKAIILGSAGVPLVTALNVAFGDANPPSISTYTSSTSLSTLDIIDNEYDGGAAGSTVSWFSPSQTSQRLWRCGNIDTGGTSARRLAASAVVVARRSGANNDQCALWVIPRSAQLAQQGAPGNGAGPTTSNAPIIGVTSDAWQVRSAGAAIAFKAAVNAAVAGTGSPILPVISSVGRPIPAGQTRTLYATATVTGDTIANLIISGPGVEGTAVASGIGTADASVATPYTPLATSGIETVTVTSTATGGGVASPVSISVNVIDSARQRPLVDAVDGGAGVVAVGGGSATAASVNDASDSTGVTVPSGQTFVMGFADYADPQSSAANIYLTLRRTAGASGSYNVVAALVDGTGFTISQIRTGSGTVLHTSPTLSVTSSTIAVPAIVIPSNVVDTVDLVDTFVRITVTAA